MALSCSLEKRATDSKLSSLECQQIDAADEQIPPEQRRIDTLYAHQRADDLEVLRLDERHLALTVGIAFVAVANEPATDLQLCGFNYLYRLFPCGPQADPA